MLAWAALFLTATCRCNGEGAPLFTGNPTSGPPPAQWSTASPTFTPFPSRGVMSAIPMPNPVARLQSANLCGSMTVLPCWLAGVGTVSQSAERATQAYFSAASVAVTTADTASGALIQATTVCFAASMPASPVCSAPCPFALLSYADAATAFNASGGATGLCTAVLPTATSGDSVTAVSLRLFGNSSDPDDCSTTPTSELEVTSIVHSDLSPALPACGSWGASLSLSLQGTGSLEGNGTAPSFFPADALAISNGSVTVVRFGADPVEPLHPRAYTIASALTLCVKSSIASVAGGRWSVSMVVPGLSRWLSRASDGTPLSARMQQGDGDCIQALQANGSSPTFYTGQLDASGRCLPSASASPLPWHLSGWVSADTQPASDPESLPMAFTTIIFVGLSQSQLAQAAVTSAVLSGVMSLLGFDDSVIKATLVEVVAPTAADGMTPCGLLNNSAVASQVTILVGAVTPLLTGNALAAALWSLQVALAPGSINASYSRTVAASAALRQIAAAASPSSPPSLCAFVETDPGPGEDTDPESPTDPRLIIAAGVVAVATCLGMAVSLAVGQKRLRRFGACVRHAAWRALSEAARPRDKAGRSDKLARSESAAILLLPRHSRSAAASSAVLPSNG